MASKAVRSKDRRQINASTPKDLRGTRADRRRCPDCGYTISAQSKSVAGGTVLTLSCGSCGWTKSSRQTDAAALLAKMSWALPLEKKGAGLQISFPSELAEALNLKAGGSLLLNPLSLP